jgi:SAM-dependent methyltransferase
MSDTDHRSLILDQFTRQAAPFAEVPAHDDAQAMDLLRRLAAVGPADDVLDSGCGPGLVACALAPHVRSVTGADLTPAMLERARSLAKTRELANVTFVPGDMERLPFPDAHFSAVVTRYTFHHLLAPERALAEMMRVCRPGGRVTIVDAAVPPTKSAAYDALEKVRDPSHVHALAAEELLALTERAGLADLVTAAYRLSMRLEQTLAASFPERGGAQRVRDMVEADVGVDRIGIEARREADGTIHYTVPCAIVSGRKR